MKTNNKKFKKAVNMIMEAAEVLGWKIALPVDNEDEVLNGLVVGTEEYINEILSDGASEDYAIWQPKEDGIAH